MGVGVDIDCAAQPLEHEVRYDDELQRIAARLDPSAKGNLGARCRRVSLLADWKEGVSTIEEMNEHMRVEFETVRNHSARASASNSAEAAYDPWTVPPSLGLMTSDSASALLRIGRDICSGTEELYLCQLLLARLLPKMNKLLERLFQLKEDYRITLSDIHSALVDHGLEPRSASLTPVQGEYSPLPGAHGLPEVAYAALVKAHRLFLWYAQLPAENQLDMLGATESGSRAYTVGTHMHPLSKDHHVEESILYDMDRSFCSRLGEVIRLFSCSVNLTLHGSQCCADGLRVTIQPDTDCAGHSLYVHHPQLVPERGELLNPGITDLHSAFRFFTSTFCGCREEYHMVFRCFRHYLILRYASDRTVDDCRWHVLNQNWLYDLQVASEKCTRCCKRSISKTVLDAYSTCVDGKGRMCTPDLRDSVTDRVRLLVGDQDIVLRPSWVATNMLTMLEEMRTRVHSHRSHGHWVDVDKLSECKSSSKRSPLSQLNESFAIEKGQVVLRVHGVKLGVVRADGTATPYRDRSLGRKVSWASLALSRRLLSEMEEQPTADDSTIGQVAHMLKVKKRAAKEEDKLETALSNAVLSKRIVDLLLATGSVRCALEADSKEHLGRPKTKDKEVSKRIVAIIMLDSGTNITLLCHLWLQQEGAELDDSSFLVHGAGDQSFHTLGYTKKPVVVKMHDIFGVEREINILGHAADMGKADRGKCLIDVVSLVQQADAMVIFAQSSKGFWGAQMIDRNGRQFALPLSQHHLPCFPTEGLSAKQQSFPDEKDLFLHGIASRLARSVCGTSRLAGHSGEHEDTDDETGHDSVEKCLDAFLQQTNHGSFASGGFRMQCHGGSSAVHGMFGGGVSSVPDRHADAEATTAPLDRVESDEETDPWKLLFDPEYWKQELPLHCQSHDTSQGPDPWEDMPATDGADELSRCDRLARELRTAERLLRDTQKEFQRTLRRAASLEEVNRGMKRDLRTSNVQLLEAKRQSRSFEKELGHLYQAKQDMARRLAQLSEELSRMAGCELVPVQGVPATSNSHGRQSSLSRQGIMPGKGATSRGPVPHAHPARPAKWSRVEPLPGKGRPAKCSKHLEPWPTVEPWPKGKQPPRKKSGPSHKSRKVPDEPKVLPDRKATRPVAGGANSTKGEVADLTVCLARYLRPLQWLRVWIFAIQLLLIVLVLFYFLGRNSLHLAKRLSSLMDGDGHSSYEIINIADYQALSMRKERAPQHKLTAQWAHSILHRKSRHVQETFKGCSFCLQPNGKLGVGFELDQLQKAEEQCPVCRRVKATRRPVRTKGGGLNAPPRSAGDEEGGEDLGGASPEGMTAAARGALCASCQPRT